MLNVIDAEETSKSLQVKDVNVSLKRHEAIETDVNARVRDFAVFHKNPVSLLRLSYAAV